MSSPPEEEIQPEELKKFLMGMKKVGYPIIRGHDFQLKKKYFEDPKYRGRRQSRMTRKEIMDETRQRFLPVLVESRDESMVYGNRDYRITSRIPVPTRAPTSSGAYYGLPGAMTPSGGHAFAAGMPMIPLVSPPRQTQRTRRQAGAPKTKARKRSSPKPSTSGMQAYSSQGATPAPTQQPAQAPTRQRRRAQPPAKGVKNVKDPRFM